MILPPDLSTLAAALVAVAGLAGLAWSIPRAFAAPCPLRPLRPLAARLQANHRLRTRAHARRWHRWSRRTLDRARRTAK